MSLQTPHTNTGEFNTLAEVAGAQAALSDLCRPFLRREFSPECVVVHPDGIPAPEDHLLVHHNHMTIVLQEHHASRVDVSVIEEHVERDYYTRMISLKTQDGKVVEYGIVRLDLSFISPRVRDEILAKKMPLGAILIKHEVHRRIKPRYFLHFPAGGQVLGLFGGTYPDPAYGRLGTIFCDGEPAIELLEIVTNTGNQ
jgi:chorismate-pyruvate lyase